MPSGAVHLIASGRVQGVGFRYFVRQKALSMGIKGWVRNLGNGDVEILAEADNYVLDFFVEAVRTGSSFANVDNLHEDWREPSGKFSTFDIAF